MKIIDNFSSNLKELAKSLVEGELVVIPTETVYGLAANALDVNAVKKIFSAKGRPQDNPLILHTFSKNEIYKYTKNQPFYVETLINNFMPGALTLVLDKSDIVPEIITAGLTTVGIRIPNNKTTLELLKLTGFPLAAPSANKSGRPSPTRVQHIIDDYGDSNLIYGIIDDGDCKIGIESTILKCEENQAIILRPGNISKKQLEDVINVDIIDYKGDKLLAPGMKYKHYSPSIPVILTDEIILNENTLNLSLNAEIDNTYPVNENNLYSVFRDAENKYNQINIIKTDSLINNTALFNRILRAVE